MIEDRIETVSQAPSGEEPFGHPDQAGRGLGVEDPFTPEIVEFAEAGVIEGYLLPDELQELCRAVLEHVERRGPERS